MNRQPRPPVLEVARLGTFPSSPDFAPAGESSGIWRVPNRPGHLFKRFNAEAARKVNSAALDRLIHQPQALTDPDDARLIAEATAWPIGRVVDGGDTVGVLVPEAPASFSVSWLARSRTNPNRHSPLPVDYLAKPNDWLAERGIRRQSPGDRLATCLSLTRVACLFERCGIVYADWSYANAFWQPDQHTVFVFDIDGCSYGPRPHVFTPEFEDPLTLDGQPVDTFTDRYRAALLVARMLTGVRRMAQVYAALRQMNHAASNTLLAMMTATKRTERPSLVDLMASFGAPVPASRPVDASGVLNWRPPPKITRRNRPPAAYPPATNPPGVTPGGPTAWRPRPGYPGPRGTTPGDSRAPGAGRARVPGARHSGTQPPPGTQPSPFGAQQPPSATRQPPRPPPPSTPSKPSSAPASKGGTGDGWGAIVGAMVAVGVIVLLVLVCF